jgi:hypothetical protein
VNKYLYHLAFALCFTCSVLVSTPAAVADEEKESLVKAAFIYNFVKFIEWPGDKSTSRLSNIDICTVGSSGINKASKVFQAASTEKLKLSLVPESNWRNADKHCHILFISASESSSIPEIIGTLRTKPLLIVSDSEQFAENGGMIGFVVNDNKIKIAVNTKAITTAGLRVDAQLLEIALKVIDK